MKTTIENPILIVPTIENKESSLAPAAEAKKKALLAKTAAVIKVSNPAEQQIAVAAQQEIKRLLDEADTAEDFFKKPFYNIYKWIMATAAAYKLQLSDEKKRIGDLVTQYQREEADRVQKENERLENERLAAQKKLDDAAAEQERVANLQRPSAKTEIKAEQAVVEAATELKQVETRAPAVITRAAGLTVKREVLFEVTDAATLYQARPEFFTLEPRRSVIKAAITKDTKLPGLKIWEDVKTNVRG